MSTNLTFRADQIPVDGKDLDLVLEPSWAVPKLGPQTHSLGVPIHVVGRIEPVGSKFVLRGRLSTRVAFDCARCAGPGEVAVEGEVVHVFVPAPVDRDAKKGAPRRDEPIDDGMTMFDGSFDIEPALTEELVLALPDYPVCKEDCPGLCSRCGADLNDGPCGCQPETDPRWSKLAQIKL